MKTHFCSNLVYDTYVHFSTDKTYAKNSVLNMTTTTYFCPLYLTNTVCPGRSV